MSRSMPRGLLAAPLLLAALVLSACGGDDTPESASLPTSPVSDVAATTATSPEGTTPATSPVETPEAEDGQDDGKAKSGDSGDSGAGASTADPASSEASSAQDAAPSGGGGGSSASATVQKLRPSAERAQNEVLKALAAIETCVTTTQDYGKCRKAEVINGFGATTVDTKRPKPTEVSVTNATKRSFKIIGTDKGGTRWVLAKARSGEVTRTCKLASGRKCDPYTW